MRTYSEEKAKQVFAALEEPFDPELLYWRPGATTKDKKKAIALVYADPRAYIDRLNEVVGHHGWSESYTTTVAPFRSVKKGWNDKPDTVVEGTKLIIVCTVTIDGLGSHSDVGEAPTDDENVATVAQAQAFKRACTKFGLGRYFYDFPKNQWAEYDADSRQITKPPTLPDWAIPKKRCEDCTNLVQSENVKGVDYSVAAILRNGQKLYQKNLCVGCQRKRADASKEAAGTRLANK